MQHTLGPGKILDYDSVSKMCGWNSGWIINLLWTYDPTARDDGESATVISDQIQEDRSK